MLAQTTQTPLLRTNPVRQTKLTGEEHPEVPGKQAMHAVPSKTKLALQDRAVTVEEQLAALDGQETQELEIRE